MHNLRQAVILLLCALMGCSQPLSVEQQIIAVIRDMEARIEAGELRPFMEHVSEDFMGQRGAIMTRDQLNALMLAQILRHQRLHAQLFPINVTSDNPGEARARFRALVTGGPGWIPESGQVYEIVTLWRFQREEWLLVHANWKPVAVEDMTHL